MKARNALIGKVNALCAGHCPCDFLHSRAGGTQRHVPYQKIKPSWQAPKSGSVLGLALGRLSQDWQARYGHSMLVVESFVDPEQFDGSVYDDGVE